MDEANDGKGKKTQKKVLCTAQNPPVFIRCANLCMDVFQL